MPESTNRGRNAFDVVAEQDTMVPVRDGVRLATDIYRPGQRGKAVDGAFPVILERTPYDKTAVSRSELRFGATNSFARPEVAEYFVRHGYVVIYQDCSEMWRQREALIHSQKIGTVGLLAGGMAHDFNNLLSIINGYCEIMGPKLGTHVARKDLNEIHRAGLKASAIARQILEFSRRHDTEASVVNFNTLIREVADIIRRVCGDGIEVQLRLASDLGNARINPVHFQQVLLNHGQVPEWRVLEQLHHRIRVRIAFRFHRPPAKQR